MSQSYVEKGPVREAPKQAPPEKQARPAKEQDEKKFGFLSEDLVYGQPVIVAFRWILIASGLVLALVNPDDLSHLRVQIVVILLLAIANFYLQAQLLMGRQVVGTIIYASSAIDLALLTVLVLSQGGYESRIFAFFYPAILAFSVVFATPITALYVAATVFVYGFICLFSDGDPVIIISRLLMLVAVGFCGNAYLRIERSRRSAAEAAHMELMTQIRSRRAREA
jgi:hypothetical protein